MPYVERDQANAIQGLFARPQQPDQESLPDDHPDVAAFRAAQAVVPVPITAAEVAEVLNLARAALPAPAIAALDALLARTGGG